MTNDLIDEKPQRRVVCAAVNYHGEIVTGARHFDAIMHQQLRFHPLFNNHLAEQGFIDQWGKFMSREEAFEVATAAGQIRHKSGNQDSKELFSEDLY